MAALASALVLTLSACSNSSNTPWQTEEQLYAADGTTWVVGDRLITVPPDASQPPQPPLGSTVRVSGVRTSRGELVIDTVEVLDTAAAQPAPPPGPTQRVQPAPPHAPTAAPAKKPRRGDDQGGGHD